jgi:hypothetical protein
VTVIVVVPGQAEPWMVSNHAFGILASEAAKVLPEVEREVLTDAAAHGALFVDDIKDPVRSRICRALAEASRELRPRLLAGNDWERSFAKLLPTLEMWLEGLLDE